MTNEPTYDAIVVGGGIAGLSAASTLVQDGRSVLLIDRFEADRNSTTMSGGWFAFSGTDEQAAAGIEDDAETFVDDMRRTGENETDDVLLRAYVDNQEDAYRWMKSVGANFGVVKISSGQSVARGHLVEIRAFTKLLKDIVISGEGSRLLARSRVHDLIVENDEVVGVAVDTAEGVQEFRSRGGVILATGGFSRSTELLAKFAPAQLAAIPYGGVGSQGDGIVMAVRLGAGLRDMDYVAATFGSHPLTGEDEHELLTAFYFGAIIVNKDGRRFTDESASYKVLGAKALEQEDGMCFQIFDSVVRAKSMPGVPLSDIGYLQDKGRVLSADTLEELAESAGIDADNFVAQVAAYNRAISEGAADEFGREGLVGGVGELLPVAEAPFYAYPAKALMTSTYAGLTVTPKTEVLRADGSVIPGLYAIGELVGGFHGTGYLTGSSLGKGVIFGRVAAREVAGILKARKDVVA